MMKKCKGLGGWLTVSLIIGLLAALVLPLLSPLVVEAAAPDQPSNVSPADGTIDISLTPAFRCSDFSDPNPEDTHFASQWQITRTPGDYSSSSLIFDNGVDDTASLTQIDIPAGYLSLNITYYWRVRHQDHKGYWSSWSIETSFTTIVSGNPSAPVNMSPVNGATDTDLTLSLQSSAFASPDGGANHAASRWQIRTGLETYDSPLFDSGIDTSNLTQIAISSGYLEYDTTYHWRVRYQDRYGHWSDWSTETFFTTAIPRPPNQPAASSPSHGATGISLTPTLRSSGFSARDEGDSHEASQWQIRAESGTYDSPVFDSGTDLVNLTRITVPDGKLDYDVTYYWRVRHQDRYGSWSAYSVENLFTTVIPPSEQPAASSPPDGATGISLTPTLQSSAFVSSDEEATHIASQWQITTTLGDYASPVYDSGLDTTNKTSITIASGMLSENTPYYWRVRYQDSNGSWSDYSSEASFTTAALPKADLSATPIPVAPRQTVTFTDTSTGDGTSWTWDFGDGTTVVEWTTDTRPENGQITHSYSSAGSYTVSLKVTGPAGEDTKTKVVLVQVPVPAPSGGKGFPWVATVAGVVVVLAGAGVLWHVRRRSLR